jgi:acetyl-CoA carboxylase biotin carboxyl carrier protein
MVKKSDSEKIRELADLLNETGLSEIDTRIRVARVGVSISAAPIAQTAAPFSAAAIDDAPADLSTYPGALISPMVGTAYISPEPGAPPFCKVGDQVSEGQTLFIVEAMKTMNPITAHKSGKIDQILVANAQAVEFGEVLAVIS